ncbi:nuclear transport factor 2 family protein [Rhodococcus sp. NPDC056960]|uniref:nuclear transport factor 2 family protein n=1 Tax=Rhodococcus sp. NPDC056960 TaxID=3345982 RepID=UPI003636BCD8
MATGFALTELTARYARAVDRREAATLAALFDTDATFVLPPALTGTGASSELRGNAVLAGAVVDAVSHLHSTRHVVHQQVIDVDESTASGETYCTAHHVYSGRNGYRDNRIALRYRDRYVLGDAGWRFVRRELIVDFSEDVPVTVPD